MRAELRQTADKFAQDEIAPIAAKVDHEDVFPVPLWKKMGDMGFLGMTVPE
jgi:isovaleryl-CoA dehydrogenase